VSTDRPPPTEPFASDPRYGSDQHGLICAFRFRPGAPAEPVDGAAAVATLASDPADQAFLWLHFSLSNAGSERWLRQHLALPAAFYEDLRERAPTRVEDAGDHLLAVLNDVVYLGSDASAASSMHACIGPRTFVTARVTPLRSVDRLRANVRAGRTFRSPCGLLAHLLTDQADVLARVVRDATGDVDLVEDRLLEGRSTDRRSRLGSLRRVLVRLQRVLAPPPAAQVRQRTRPPRWMDEDDLGDLRTAAEELAAAVADAAALGERVRLIQEEIAAHVGEQTSRTLFILTIVTVLALPMTIIPGLFGMNVGGIPFQAHDHGFWLALVVALATAAAGYLLVRVLRP
jgi:zinc transporter